MSDNEQKNGNCETIADVIAIVREIVKFYEKVAKTSKGQLKESFVLTAKNYRMIADLIEAAWARESKAIATENAVLPAVCITKPSGNAAAMRNALVAIKGMFRDIDLRCDTMEGEAYRVATAALSAPPRQCDVGTAEEQYRRHDAFCKATRNEMSGYHCEDAPRCVLCFSKWAQMPYEAEGESDE